MRHRGVAASVVTFVSVLLYTIGAHARGRGPNSKSCDSTLAPAERAHDECGVILDVHVDLAYVPLPADVAARGPENRATTFVARAPTLFGAVGVGAGYLFPGHLGVRFFALDFGASTAATYQDARATQTDRHGSLFGNVDVGGLVLHGRAQTRSGDFSYLVDVSPNVAVLGVVSPSASGGEPFVGVRTSGQICHANEWRVCLAVGVDVSQLGRAFDGGTVGLSFPLVW